MRLVLAYVAAFVALIVLDGVWLGAVARAFYADRLGSLLKDEPDLLAAALFYVAYPAGLVFLAVRPAVARSVRAAALDGAVLGLVAYGTYDLTNLATLRGWPVDVTVVDILWGTVLGAACAAAGCAAARFPRPPRGGA